MLSLINSDQERLSIDPAGNVGIGTTAPSARLDVVSGSHPQLEVRTSDEIGDDAGVIIQGARNGSTNVDAAYIDFRNFDSDEGPGGTEYATARIGAGMDAVSGQTGFLRLWTNSGAGLRERVRIASDGNVGVGEAAPQSRLHVRTKDLGVNPAALENDEILVEGQDAVLGLYSEPQGTWSSAIALKEVSGGNVVDTWGIARETSIASSPSTLHFTYGTSSNYASNPSYMSIGNNGNVGMGTASPNSRLHLSSAGPVTLTLEADTNNVNESDNANIRFSQDGGNISARLGYANGSNIFEITQEQNNGVRIGVGGSTIFEIAGATASFKDSLGANAVSFGRTTNDAGAIELYGNNGGLNVLISHGGSNRGLVQVYDENQAAQAGMYVDNNGNGIVFGDTKQFRVPNPADPKTDICYASLEGPEAAAYLRGTAGLVDGQAVIELPEHFRAVASPYGMTVNVTPLSADSASLAVIQKSTSRVVVRELNRGAGSYDFDYMIAAVRKGHEKFNVIQPTRRRAGDSAPAAARAHRDEGPGAR